MFEVKAQMPIQANIISIFRVQSKSSRGRVLVHLLHDVGHQLFSEPLSLVFRIGPDQDQVVVGHIRSMPLGLFGISIELLQKGR